MILSGPGAVGDVCRKGPPNTFLPGSGELLSHGVYFVEIFKIIRCEIFLVGMKTLRRCFTIPHDHELICIVPTWCFHGLPSVPDIFIMVS